MPEKTLTEAAYEFIEGLESRKKRMIAVIVICFVLGPVGLGFDWIAVDHEKGGLADLATNPLIIITAIASIIIMTYGINRYFLIEKWGNQLKQLDQLEETIYKEVLGSKDSVEL
jgi:TM2 domain-containing membrane protein YozV